MRNYLRILLYLLIIAGLICRTAAADELAKTQKRAEQGDPEALYELGMIYKKGTGVGQDYPKAGAFFAKAAEKDHADAQYELACLYYGGIGVEQDKKKAQSLFNAAAEHGSAEAQYFLARMYNKGREV